MGSKFSASRLRKYMQDGSVPNIVTSTITSSYDTTTINTIEHNSTHSGTTTFQGIVQFSGSIYNSMNLGPTVASGSTQLNAALLPTGSYVYVCTSDSNTKGIVLQNYHKQAGLTFIVVNDDATNNSFNLYPPTNGKLDNAEPNLPINIDRGKSYMLVCFDAGAAPKWAVIGL